MSFIYSGYFYSASSSSPLLKGAPDYSIDTVSDLIRLGAIGNCEGRTCPRTIYTCMWRLESGIRTCNHTHARRRTYHEPPRPTVIRQLADLIFKAANIKLIQLLLAGGTRSGASNNDRMEHASSFPAD